MFLGLNSVLSFCPIQAHAHPLINTAYFPAEGLSIRCATGIASAFISDIQTQSLSKLSSFDCANPTTNENHRHQLLRTQLHIISTCIYWPAQLRNLLRAPIVSVLFARVRATLDSMLAINAKIAGSVFASARKPFVQYVLRAIRKFTIFKARNNDHMPEMFDITAISYNASAIQVQIDGSTDNLHRWDLDHNSHPSYSLIFCAL